YIAWLLDDKCQGNPSAQKEYGGESEHGGVILGEGRPAGPEQDPYHELADQHTNRAPELPDPQQDPTDASRDGTAQHTGPGQRHKAIGDAEKGIGQQKKDEDRRCG